MTDDSLSTHLDRATLEPDPAFTAQANGTQDMYAAAEADHEGHDRCTVRSRKCVAQEMQGS